MAVADQPSGLMDIASTLTQDEIPFKLRCAICNKLAVNAFRLPCCEQAICESCQASLPDTCPVCAHTPLSSDLCKPNKALRTTLKAFLRTEEKKREKDRQSATPAAPADGTPASPEQPVTDTAPDAPAPIAPGDQNATEEKPEVAPSVEAPPEEPPVTESGPVEAEESAPDANPEGPAEPQPQNDQEDDATGTSEKPDVADQNGPGEGDETTDGAPAQFAEQENTSVNGMQPMPPNAMGFNMPPGGFPIGWNGSDFNPMAQFMPNGMFNSPNPMGMSGMAMDPMTASQGMLGGYGMNMNGMNSGMNMGMNFDAGQGMYGGWDGSQNNMWNGGQDKFNPNAFANGMGSQYGPSSGFGGYNNYAQMQHQPFPNQDFSNGYYGTSYGRGNFRGRGRGFIPGGRGRGGFPGSTMHANYPNAHNPAFHNPNSPSFTQAMLSQGQDGEMASAEPSGTEEKSLGNGQSAGDEQDHTTQDPSSKEPADETMGDQHSEGIPADAPATEGFPGADNPHLQGIPTIDTFNQTNAMSTFVGMPGQMGPGFGRGYMRGPFPGGRGAGFPGSPFGPGPNMPGPGVEGAPAAPRAMRQGLPNTSVLRHRQLQAQGRGSISASRPSEVSQSATPVEPQEEGPRSRSRSRSRPRSPSRLRNRSRSPTRHQSDSRRRHRYRSPSAHSSADEYEGRRERQKRSRREEKYEESAAEEGYRTRSPSLESSRRSRRHERERDRRSGRRSRRSHRHRSRTQSPSRNGDARDTERLSAIPEENGSSNRDRDKAYEALEPSSRSHRSGKDRPSRREEERERDREARRRDRDRDRDRRDRDRDRDRYRERDRERDRDRDRERHRDRERDRDSKRSRRDRTASPVDSDYSTRHHTRRTKRSREEGDNHHHHHHHHHHHRGDKISSSKATTDEPEKDPHTLEREARNRERLLKEQQRREAMQPETDHSHSHPHRDRDRDRDRGDRDRDGHHNHKSSRRRDSRSRQDRLTGGRRLSYKYEDDERAARVEEEREADRWA